LPGGVEADVVGVAAEVGPRALGPGARVEGAAGPVAAAANQETVLVREKEEPLRLIDAGQAVNAATLGEVNDFDRMVLQGGDEELARGEVNGHVVEPALDPVERGGADAGERARLRDGGRWGAGRGQEQGQCGERLHVSASLCRHGRMIVAEQIALVAPDANVRKA